MSNGIRLDGLPGMQELVAVLHQEFSQGRHILPLENVPNCSCPSVPVAIRVQLHNQVCSRMNNLLAQLSKYSYP